MRTTRLNAIIILSEQLPPSDYSIKVPVELTPEAKIKTSGVNSIINTFLLSLQANQETVWVLLQTNNF